MRNESRGDRLERLAGLLKIRNVVASEITAVIGRPEQIGHIGEFIASEIFEIQLAPTAVHKGSDGVFRSGPLAGKTVNIKWYAKRENILDIREDALPDYYLVLTGPRSNVMHSRGESRLWSIESVFLFDAHALVPMLRQKRLKVGIATSIAKNIWEKARLHPDQNNDQLILTQHQRQQLQMFSAEAVT